MADNSSVPVASGNETFANKDIGGVKFPKNIQYDSSGAEVVPATQTTAAAILAKIIAAPATEAKQDSTITQETAINTVLGTTSGAAVTTNATGTIQQYLRGIVSLLVSGITVATHAVTQSGSWVISAGSALIGKVDIQVAGSALATGSGANGATVLRTALATDSPGVMPSSALTAATAPASGIATLAQYNATNPAPTDTQTVALQVGPNGALLVQPYGNPANLVSGLTTQMTGTTSTAVTGMGAPGSGLRNYITQVTVSNAHATVGTEISLQDGSGGTSFYTFPAAAVYGGAAVPFPAPLKQPTANTALYAVNLTTGAATKVSVSGYKGI